MKAKIPICIEGQEQILTIRTFRNLLIAKPQLRNSYQALKIKLEQEHTKGVGDYLAGKTPFVNAALKDALTVQHGAMN